MSRSFIPDQELIDRLMIDDASAFEEIYRRHWHSLYAYSFQKLHSSIEARRIVRSIFIQLWEKRKSFSIGFTLSEFLYTEVRRLVVIHLSTQLNGKDEYALQQLKAEFKVEALQQARLPVVTPDREPVKYLGNHQKHPRLFVTLSHMKWLFQNVTARIL